jgi:hypothetical protein
MCLDPLHGLSMGIRNRAVVIYRDDQSCTHPGPFWLTYSVLSLKVGGDQVS